MKKTRNILCLLISLSTVLSLMIFHVKASDNLIDYCLDESGNIREGVKITAHYTKSDGTEVVFNAGDNGKADGDGNGSNDPLSWVLTSAQSYWGGGGQPGFWIGWKGGGVKDSYYLQVDLGAARDINEIGFVPYGSSDSWWRTDRIFLSNDENFETKYEVTSGSTIFDNKKMTTFTYSADETKSYRYIRICTLPGDVICGVTKLVVKGYCDDLYGRWEMPEITGGGEYSVTLPVTHFADAKEYSMQISAYNENSELTAFSNERISAADGLLSGRIDVPDGTVSMQAAIVNNAADMLYSNGIAQTGTAPYAKEDVLLSGDEFAEFTATDNVITVKAKGEPDDIITLQVLKNCDKSKTAEEYFAQIGENLNDNMYFSAAAVSGNGVGFTVPFNETGLYCLRAVRSDKKSSDSVYYRFSMVSDEKKDEFVYRVFETDGSDWDAIVSEYVDDLELLTDSNILSVDEIKADGFAQVLVKTRNMLFNNDDEKTLDSVSGLVNSAIEMNRLYNGDFDAAENDIRRCPELAAAIGEYASFSRFAKVLKDILKKSDTPEETLTVLDRAAILSYIQDGTAEEIMKALEKFGAEGAIDISDCDKAGVSLERVAARIDNSKASDLYGDNLKNRFTAAIAAEKEYINQTEKKTTVNKGGGGGGGIMPITKQTENGGNNTETEQKPETDTNKTEFADLDNYGWAKTQIQALCDSGVLNGYDDKTFNPSGNVTRAEFVKMLVCGLEITVNETKKMKFTDCSGGDWFYPYVAIAYSVSIVNGVDDFSFGTSDPITRRDLAVMMYNAVRYKGKIMPVTDYVCGEELPEYATEPFNAMIENGIINGYDDGTFNPSGYVTRAEAAVMLYRVIDFIEGGAK